MNALGMWSAIALFVVGVIYAIAVAFGMYTVGLTGPIVDPILAIMEILTLVAASLLVILMSTIHCKSLAEYRVFSSIALAFAVLVAGLTGAVHFIGLTALRQIGTEGIVWPSAIYAVELLAWDVFLGLSLLFAAPVFRGAGLNRNIRTGLIVTGVLCLTGTLGPATGDMRLQFIAVLGYGVFLPVVCLMIARYFRK
jgi:hypothetical protein